MTFLILNIAVLAVVAQTPRLYTTQMGLASSDIRGIDIDSRGVAWISGPMSLSLFNGSTFSKIPLTNKETGKPVCSIVYGIKELPENKNLPVNKGKYLIKTSNGLFHYDISEDKLTFIHLREDEDIDNGFPISNVVDYPKPGRLLTLTGGFGVFVVDYENMVVDTLETQKVRAGISRGFFTASFLDKEWNLWFCDYDKNLCSFNLKTLKYNTLNFTPEASSILQKNNVYCICGNTSKVYFGTNAGVLSYEKTTGIVSAIDCTLSINAHVDAIRLLPNGNLLIGTDSRGLWEMTQTSEGYNVEKYRMNRGYFDLDYGKVKCITQTSNGVLLVGMMQKGLLVLPPRSDSFSYYPVSLSGNGLNSTCITSMATDAEGNFWISTDGCGVFRTNGPDLYSTQPVNKGLNSLLVQRVLVDKHQNVWVGIYGGGVQCCKKGNDYFETPDWLQEFSIDPVLALDYDENNDALSIGVNGRGVFIAFLEKKTIFPISQAVVQNSWISALHYSPNDLLWVGTASGVYYTGENTKGEARFENSHACTIQCISTLLEESKSQSQKYLIGTNQGLVIYDLSTKEPEYLLKNEYVMSVEQTKSDIWVSTSNAIYSISKKDRQVNRYSSFGGMFLGEFHRRSSMALNDDKLFFGADDGIISITPSKIKQPQQLVNPLVFFGLRIGAREEQVNIPDELVLESDENSFAVRVGVPHFVSSSRIQYSYRLEGYEDTWRTFRGASEIYYSSLPSGHYKLIVKACYETDKENYKENTLKVTVKYPWYGTVWAWLAYIIIVFILLFAMYRSFLARRRQKALLRKANENERLKDARLHLFTGIIHELRSPLTMIISPLNQLMSSNKDEGAQNLYRVMKRNCDRLLQIVKQITDIRSIDSGALKLKFSEVNFYEYSDSVYSSFSSNATLKQISFVVEHADEIVSMWIDDAHFEKILTNILSNAFKFTPEGGRIIIKEKVEKEEATKLTNAGKGGKMVIRIYNSGSHIDDKDLPHIFDRFYQGNSKIEMAGDDQPVYGSGIGLSLVYELVAMHHGDISVHNVDPDGVEFVLQFPIGNSHLQGEEVCLEKETAPASSVHPDVTADIEPAEEVGEQPREAGQEGASSVKPLVLFVDDDRELCSYVSGELKKFYNVIVAYGGNSAWNIVLSQRPDAVVTDVRMPDGDGIELCKHIKNYPETDNIPIIMLTSENGEDARLRSLTLEVDHFLNKPFNMMILQGAINQVLHVRDNLRKRMSRKDVGNDYSAVNIDSADEKLFNKINELIVKNLDDASFGVEQLAEEVGLSRVHLNRKMKERYGVGPNIYIKTFRMKQAAYLLAHTYNVNISDVAYKVGYTSPSYFGRSFHEAFGMTPKEFVAQYSDNLDDETLKKLLE